MSLAMRLADTEPGSPEASDFSAASSMLSRVALPRRLVRRPAIPAPLPALSSVDPMVSTQDFHRGYCDF